MTYKYFAAIVLLILSVRTTFAMSYKREQYARNFYTYGFLVTDEEFNKKSIKLPITTYIDNNYKMLFSSDISNEHEFSDNTFLICDKEFKKGQFTCNADSATGPASNIVYFIGSRVGGLSPLYVLDQKKPQVYLIPENYLLETSKRIELNRYISRLYELELKNQSKTTLETKSEELYGLLHSPLFEASYLLILCTYFYISLELILKGSKRQGIRLLALEIFSFLAFYLNYFFAKKDYFVSFKQYLYDSLTPNYLVSLLKFQEYNLLFNSILFLTIIIFNLCVVTIYVLKKVRVDARNFRPTVIKFIQVGLFVLMFGKNIFISIASGLTFLFTLSISSKKIVRVILYGIVLGLSIKYFSDNYVKRNTQLLFPSNRDYVLLPFTARTQSLSSTPTIAYPKGYLFADGYLLFSPTHKVLSSKNIAQFTSEGNYIVYTSEFNNSIIKDISTNPELKSALTSKEPSPFGYFDLSDSKLDSIVVRTKLKCLGNRVINVTMKPYYRLHDEAVSTDLNRINLYENFGCDSNQKYTDVFTKLPTGSFIAGTNYFRLTADVSDEVIEVGVIVNGKDIKINYLTNFYDSGILAINSKDKSEQITVYSPSILKPETLTLDQNNNSLNLVSVVEELKNKGMINEEVVLKSEQYGEALLYEQ